MTDNFLGDMYNDFFGPGSGGDGKPPKFDDPKTEKEIKKQVDEDFEKEKENKDDAPVAEKITEKYTKKIEEDRPIQDADEALREARALFGATPSLRNKVATGGNDPVEPQVEEPKEKEPETDPMDDLNALIGLASIKHDVKELTDFVKVQKLRKDEGMKAVPVSLHLVFTGNPGTGKTTVARIISRIYKQIGVLSKGQLIEVDRSGLVAGYVGQTALKTQEKINQALGGVLFIDEAYSLAQENDAFGQEAIDTILKAMEDHRDDLVVIVAGYTEPMEKFISSNPGLKSRFNKYIEFPDYSIDELEEIFYMNCNKYEYEVEEDSKKHIREMISARKLAHTENFANAREVRNIFEEIVTNQARRIAAIENPTAEDIKTIISKDLVEESEIKESSTKNETDSEIAESSTKNETESEIAEASTKNETDSEIAESSSKNETDSKNSDAVADNTEAAQISEEVEESSETSSETDDKVE